MKVKEIKPAVDVQQYYIDSGIDLKNRRIMVNQEINHVTVGWYIRALQLMEQANCEFPIEVTIMSYGGDIYAGLALYDALVTLKSPVVTIAHGPVASMGYIIYLAGDERVSYPRASFMHHAGAAGLDEPLTAEDLKNNLEEMDRIENICHEIIADRTRKGKKWWEKESKGKNMWFGPKDAKKWGVCHRVVGEE